MESRSKVQRIFEMSAPHQRFYKCKRRRPNTPPSGSTGRPRPGFTQPLVGVFVCAWQAGGSDVGQHRTALAQLDWVSGRVYGNTPGCCLKPRPRAATGRGCRRLLLHFTQPVFDDVADRDDADDLIALDYRNVLCWLEQVKLLWFG
jgi:hypothetical protein